VEYSPFQNLLRESLTTSCWDVSSTKSEIALLPWWVHNRCKNHQRRRSMYWVREIQRFEFGAVGHVSTSGSVVIKIRRCWRKVQKRHRYYKAYRKIYVCTSVIHQCSNFRLSHGSDWSAGTTRGIGSVFDDRFNGSTALPKRFDILFSHRGQEQSRWKHRSWRRHSQNSMTEMACKV